MRFYFGRKHYRQLIAASRFVKLFCADCMLATAWMIEQDEWMKERRKVRIETAWYERRKDEK